MIRSRLARVVLAFLVLALLAGCAGGGASDFPNRQVTYLVTFDPGGQSDREARRQQPLLEKILGQKVVIDYKVGGGGALGWSELARAKPDGYLFAGFNLPHIILQPLQQETGYKTDQIHPVAIFQRTILGLAVLNTSPYKTLDDFIKAAKENPGAISISGSGTFSGPHFATTRLEQLVGVKFNYVPFTGAAPATTNFLGGHTVATFGNSDDLVKHRDRIRVLAFADEKRFPLFPDVPTFKELKLDLVEVVDRGVAVPKGTPAAVVKKLESAFLQIARDPAIQEAMKKEGFVPLAMGSEEAQDHIKRLTASYQELLKGMKK